MSCRILPNVKMTGGQYPMAASSSDLQSSLPLALSKLTTRAPSGPPTSVMSCLPSTSGAAAIPQVGILVPKSFVKFFFQTILPFAVS